jgi:hypothetical protein
MNKAHTQTELASYKRLLIQIRSPARDSPSGFPAVISKSRTTLSEKRIASHSTTADGIDIHRVVSLKLVEKKVKFASAQPRRFHVEGINKAYHLR